MVTANSRDCPACGAIFHDQKHDPAPALTLAQQEARAAALEEALQIVEESNTARWNKIAIAAKLRALLEGK